MDTARDGFSYQVGDEEDHGHLVHGTEYDSEAYYLRDQDSDPFAQPDVFRDTLRENPPDHYMAKGIAGSNNNAFSDVPSFLFIPCPIRGIGVKTLYTFQRHYYDSASYDRATRLRRHRWLQRESKQV